MEKNTQRGMVKWAPFKSLETQENYIHKAIQKQYDVEMPILSSDQMEEINEQLCSYHNQIVIIKFYENKRIKEVEGYITKLDPIEKFLRLGRKTIYFNSLINICSQE